MVERYSFAYPRLPWGSSPPVFIEWVRASDYDALAARLAEALEEIRRLCPHHWMLTDSASVDYEQVELERMLKQEAKAHASASADAHRPCNQAAHHAYGYHACPDCNPTVLPTPTVSDGVK